MKVFLIHRQHGAKETIEIDIVEDNPAELPQVIVYGQTQPYRFYVQDIQAMRPSNSYTLSIGMFHRGNPE